MLLIRCLIAPKMRGIKRYFACVLVVGISAILIRWGLVSCWISGNPVKFGLALPIA